MKFTFDMKDMALNIEQWTRLANDCQCKHDDMPDVLEGKRTKLCKLQGIIKKAIPNVIADCNDLLSSFPMSLATYNDEVYPDIKTGTIVAKCLSFMNEACNISLRREFEKDTAEKREERAEQLEEVRQFFEACDKSKRLLAEVCGYNRIYHPNGIYEKYIDVSDTPEYKLLRKIEDSNVDNKDITLYYQAVCLYVALEDERQYIELSLQTEETTRGGTPKEGGGGGLPSEEKTPNQQKKALPPELDTPEAKALLQKVINAGYCDESLHWFSDKGQWAEINNIFIGKGGEKQKSTTTDRSILALACLAIKTTCELKIKTLTQNGKKGVAWAVFEKAFTYDGQIPDTNRIKMKEVALCYCRCNSILSFEDLPDNAPDIIKQGIGQLFL